MGRRESAKQHGIEPLRHDDVDTSSRAASGRWRRRDILKSLAALGIGNVVFQRALAAQAAENGAVTAEMIAQAEWVAGLELSEEDRESTASAMQRLRQRFEALRAIEIDHGVPPAVVFNPAPALPPAIVGERGNVQMMERSAAERPSSDEDLAFLPVTELAALLRSRQVSSLELTRLYLDRLQKYDKALKCVVSFTDALALAQAKRADREMAAGRYRGPLHGVPWGAKDLISYPGYKTTWGAKPFEDQKLDTKATVAQRLDDAGAVLVAKLSLGALAQGDKWFGGMTRNPWNVEQGSSGSSAGSASAVAAGLVGFAIGSETLGSIVSPCTRCGATGLRPTFGRVSRFGCMTLAWSMDKLGPITRSVEDCALVFDAIHGRDGLDPTAVERPFFWPRRESLRNLKVGYIADGKPMEERPELVVLKELGVTLVEIQLPDDLPVWAITLVLNTEASCVFDDLTRRGITEGLNSWPNSFRQGQFTPAVEYLRANRARTLLMREMEKLMTEVDAYVGGDDLAITNLTGHPCVVLPNGFVEKDGVATPTALTFTGRLYDETTILALAHAFQQATDFHLRRPPLERLELAVENGEN